MGWLRRRWRWFTAHDPISTVAAALIPHRAFLGWLTVISFFLLLAVPATRAEVITTLWAVIGAGLVVSVILAEQGERIQRRVWLRENAPTVGDFLNRVTATVFLVGLVGVGVHEPTRRALAFGADRAERRRATAETRQVIAEFGKARPLPLANLPYEYRLLSEHFQGLDRLMDDNASLLPRMTDALGAMQYWKSIALMTLHQLPNDDTGFTMEILEPGGTTRRRADDPAARELRRGLFVNLAIATVDLCERCSNLLEEAGLLPS